jgi:hypothetical protein
MGIVAYSRQNMTRICLVQPSDPLGRLRREVMFRGCYSEPDSNAGQVIHIRASWYGTYHRQRFFSMERMDTHIGKMLSEDCTIAFRKPFLGVPRFARKAVAQNSFAFAHTQTQRSRLSGFLQPSLIRFLQQRNPRLSPFSRFVEDVRTSDRVVQIHLFICRLTAAVVLRRPSSSETTAPQRLDSV